MERQEQKQEPLWVLNIAGQWVDQSNVLYQESFVDQEIPIEAYEDDSYDV